MLGSTQYIAVACGGNFQLGYPWEMRCSSSHCRGARRRQPSRRPGEQEIDIDIVEGGRRSSSRPRLWRHRARNGIGDAVRCQTWVGSHDGGMTRCDEYGEWRCWSESWASRLPYGGRSQAAGVGASSAGIGVVDTGCGGCARCATCRVVLGGTHGAKSRRYVSGFLAGALSEQVRESRWPRIEWRDSGLVRRYWWIRCETSHGVAIPFAPAVYTSTLDDFYLVARPRDVSRSTMHWSGSTRGWQGRGRATGHATGDATGRTRDKPAARVDVARG